MKRTVSLLAAVVVGWSANLLIQEAAGLYEVVRFDTVMTQCRANGGSLDKECHFRVIGAQVASEAPVRVLSFLNVQPDLWRCLVLGVRDDSLKCRTVAKLTGVRDE